MINIRTTLLALTLIALGANAHSAQSAGSGVTESTDPARATAVEQAARDIETRRAQRALSGRPASSASVVSGRTDGDIAFLSGGITVGDRVAMHAQRERFGLWIATVAKGSGAYLTDARLRIVDLKQHAVVLDRIADGPWFMLALPAGRYEISATLLDDGAAAPQTITSRVDVPRKGQRQAVLRFDSSAKVSSEMRSPFNGNPFGAQPAAQ